MKHCLRSSLTTQHQKEIEKNILCKRMSNVCILLNEYFQHARETINYKKGKKKLIISCKKVDYFKRDFKQLFQTFSCLGGGGGLLPYISHIGMCRPHRVGFCAVLV